MKIPLGKNPLKKEKDYIQLLETVIYFFLFYIIGVLEVFIFQKILPPKYYYDANTIKKFVALTTQIIPFNSYNNIAFFYKVSGFNQNSNLLNAGFYTFTIGYIFTLIAINLSKIYINKIFLFTIFMWITLLSLYLGQFSKEVSVVVLSTILLFFAKNKEKSFLFVALVLISLYAYYFRIYWFIILYLIFIFYISEKLKGVAKYLFILGALFIPFIISNYILQFPLTGARTSVNFGRINSLDAQTIILNPLPNNIWLLDFLNSLIIFISFIIPITILMKLKFKYIISTLFIWINFYILLKSIQLFKTYKFLIPKQTLRRLKFSIYFIIAFTMTQSIFEPDYGSFLKHQVGISPIYVFLFSYYFYLKNFLKGGIYENNTYSRIIWRWCV